MTGLRSYRKEDSIAQSPHLPSTSHATAIKKQFLGDPHTYQHEYAQSVVYFPQKPPTTPALSRSVDAPFADQSLQNHFVAKTKQQQPKRKGKRVWRWAVGIATVITIIVVVFSQANGQGGAWVADTLRAVVGPTVTAQIESWYLGLSDMTH